MVNFEIPLLTLGTILAMPALASVPGPPTQLGLYNRAAPAWCKEAGSYWQDFVNCKQALSATIKETLAWLRFIGICLSYLGHRTELPAALTAA